MEKIEIAFVERLSNNTSLHARFTVTKSEWEQIQIKTSPHYKCFYQLAKLKIEDYLKAKSSLLIAHDMMDEDEECDPTVEYEGFYEV